MNRDIQIKRQRCATQNAPQSQKFDTEFFEAEHFGLCDPSRFSFVDRKTRGHSNCIFFLSYGMFVRCDI